MKKFISILVVAMLLVTSLLVAVPSSAADTKTINIDWSAYDYVAYGDSGYQVDESVVLENFTVTKTADTLKLDRTAGGIQSNSYIASTQFAITATTSYTYEVLAKNNNTTKYSGVPFAIDTEGNVYFIYGSFDNNNDSDDSQSGKSYVIGAKADFDNKYPNSTDDELDSMYFAKLLQTDGFASFKFAYEGLTVKVYAKNESGSYIQMGEDIPIPDGSKLCFGVFSRDNSNGGNRTTTVKNGKITANNAESVTNMSGGATSNGSSELKAEIAKVEKEYLEVDYTEDSFAAYKEALDNAKAVADDAASTAADVTDALTTLQTAVDGLELAEVDTTKLEEAIAKAEALKEVEYTTITFGMVEKAVATGKALLEDAEAKQSQINAATEDIEGRIEALQPSGDVAEPDDEGEADGDATEPPATDAPAGDAGTQPITPAPAPAKKGCGSAVATTAVVLGLVATLGTALVIKKRD